MAESAHNFGDLDYLFGQALEIPAAQNGGLNQETSFGQRSYVDDWKSKLQVHSPGFRFLTSNSWLLLFELIIRFGPNRTAEIRDSEAGHAAVSGFAAVITFVVELQLF